LTKITKKISVTTRQLLQIHKYSAFYIQKGKIKGKVIPLFNDIIKYYATKAWWSRDRTPPFLTSAVEVSGQLHALAALPLGKESILLTVQGLGGPQSQYGGNGEEKNLLSLPGVKPYFLSHLASSMVTIPTELSWLHIVTRYLKVGVVEPEVRDVAMQQLDKHVSMAMDARATIEEMLETMFSMGSVPRR
jgi:hypothetical protein